MCMIFSAPKLIRRALVVPGWRVVQKNIFALVNQKFSRELDCTGCSRTKIIKQKDELFFCRENYKHAGEKIRWKSNRAIVQAAQGELAVVHAHDALNPCVSHK